MARLPHFRNPFSDPDNYVDAGRAVGELFDPRQSVSDAYWSLTHPRDRVMGRGRAQNQQMAFPLGGRWSPKTPGLRAEALQKGDEWVDYVGDVDRFKKPSEPGGMQIESDMGWLSPARKGYNLRNEKNEIVASGDTLRGMAPHKRAYIPSIWVREDYRKTPAFNDLIRIITHDGKLEPVGEAINPRLQTLLARKNDPERLKALKAVAKNVKPKPKNPELTPPRPRSQDVQMAIALHQERLAKAQGTRVSVRTQVENSRARDNAAAAKRQAEHARMERNLGMAHKYNPKRRGGV